MSATSAVPPATDTGAVHTVIDGNGRGAARRSGLVRDGIRYFRGRGRRGHHSCHRQLAASVPAKAENTAAIPPVAHVTAKNAPLVRCRDGFGALGRRRPGTPPSRYRARR